MEDAQASLSADESQARLANTEETQEDVPMAQPELNEGSTEELSMEPTAKCRRRVGNNSKAVLQQRSIAVNLRKFVERRPEDVLKSRAVIGELIDT